MCLHAVVPAQAILQRTARPIFSSTRAGSGRCAGPSGERCRRSIRPRFRRRSRSARPRESEGAGRSPPAPERVRAALAISGAEIVAAPGSVHPAQGAQEPRRAGGRPHRPPPRRRRHGAFPALARASPRRKAASTEIAVAEKARRVPPGHRRAEGSVLRHHRRRRPQRRHPALSRDAANRTASSRTNEHSSASIPAASIRTAPPTSPAPSSSASRPPKCRTASPACSRA